MSKQLIISLAIIATCQAGIISPSSYDSHNEAVATTQQDVLRSHDGTYSQYSKSIETPYASVHKQDTRISSNYQTPTTLAVRSQLYTHATPIVEKEEQPTYTVYKQQATAVNEPTTKLSKTVAYTTPIHHHTAPKATVSHYVAPAVAKYAHVQQSQPQVAHYVQQQHQGVGETVYHGISKDQLSTVYTSQHVEQPSAHIVHHEAPTSQIVHHEAPATFTVHHDTPVAHTAHFVHQHTPATHVVQHDTPTAYTLQHSKPNTHYVQQHVPATHIVHQQEPSSYDLHQQEPSTHFVHHEAPATHTIQHTGSTAHIVHHEAPATHFVKQEVPATYSIQQYTPVTKVVQHSAPSAHLVHHEVPAARSLYNEPNVAYSSSPAASATTYSHNSPVQAGYGTSQTIHYSPSESVSHMRFEGFGTHYGF